MALQQILSKLPKKIPTTATAAATTTTYRRYCNQFYEVDKKKLEQIDGEYHGLIKKGLNNAFFIYPTNDFYIVRLDMPGIRNSDLKTSITGSKIYFSAQEPQPHRFGLGHCEPRFYDAEFEFDPEVYDADKVDAEVKNGVLWIKVPSSRAGPGLGKVSWAKLHIGRVKCNIDPSGKTKSVLSASESFLNKRGVL